MFSCLQAAMMGRGWPAAAAKVGETALGVAALCCLQAMHVKQALASCHQSKQTAERGCLLECKSFSQNRSASHGELLLGWSRELTGAVRQTYCPM